MSFVPDLSFIIIQGSSITFLINKKAMILSKLTCGFIYMLFHHVVALLWYPFVFLITVILYPPTPKKCRIPVHPCLLAYGRGRMEGERLLASLSP